jgi:hypothetical protein
LLHKTVSKLWEMNNGCGLHITGFTNGIPCSDVDVLLVLLRINWWWGIIGRRRNFARFTLTQMLPGAVPVGFVADGMALHTLSYRTWRDFQLIITVTVLQVHLTCVGWTVDKLLAAFPFRRCYYVRCLACFTEGRWSTITCSADQNKAETSCEHVSFRSMTTLNIIIPERQHHV